MALSAKQLFDERLPDRPDDGCWIWQGTVKRDGFGQLVYRAGEAIVQVVVHRFAWSIFHGPITRSSTIVQVCENRLCCNPAHLEKISWSRYQQKKTIKQRFLDGVDRSAGPNECHPWKGAPDKNGYGRLAGANGKPCRAHRMALMLSIGPIPDNLLVMHTCDNPPCCNPLHLRVGTSLDNMHDKIAKGRARYSNSKLNTFLEEV